jgi:antitoxin CptB
MIKKLIYRSHYRSTKEADLILGSFAKNKLSNCPEKEIKKYSDLLEFRDTEIHEWVISPQKSPPHLKSIVLKIAKFHGFVT